MGVDPVLSSVMCMACTKHFTDGHLTNRKHVNYRENFMATMQWIRQEQKLCNALLHETEQRAGPRLPQQPVAPAHRAPAAPADAQADGFWDETLPEEPPASWEERAEAREARWKDIALPPTPTLEQNFDFAAWLVPELRNIYQDVKVFNTPLGVEEC